MSLRQILSVLLLSLICSTAAYADPLPVVAEAPADPRASTPNVIFLLDLSTGMDADCGGVTCLELTRSVLSEVIAENDWAWFGVVGTASSAMDDTYVPIAPIRSTREELLAHLATMQSSGTNVRNLAEALAALSLDYLSLDADAGQASFAAAPICASCQDTYVVTITTGLPRYDDNPAAWDSLAAGWNYTCDDYGNDYTASDTRCMYDNVVGWAYDTDHRPDLDGVQGVITHTIGLGFDYDTNEVAATLAVAAAYAAWPEGRVSLAWDPDYLRVSVLAVLDEIRRDRAFVSAPLPTFDDSILVTSFYETGVSPLAQGHLRAFRMGTDPFDLSTWGRPIEDGPAAYGGAMWDAGVLLQGRYVPGSEYNGGDFDGYGRRDIFTYVPELRQSYDMDQQARLYGRMSFDRSMVRALYDDPWLLDLFLPPGTGGPEVDADLDWDGDVDVADFQRLVDFVRGVEWVPFRHLWWSRGDWRLGDSPTGSPTIVRATQGRYGTDPTYRHFLDQLRASDAPDIVLTAANDGMLHAFRLTDGRELWAWVPGYLLYRQPHEDWSGRLMDLIVRGRVSLLEGTPVVEDVWIDDDGDGERECDDTRCEWHRVAVVGQGRGGPVVLALDITDPERPVFLWEHLNLDQADANGYTVSTPVMANVGNAWEVGGDHWVALWGSGRPVSDQIDAGAFGAMEPNLYGRALGEDFLSVTWTSHADQVLDATLATSGLHAADANATSLTDTDADGRFEQAHIAGQPAVVDVDADGDADIAYVVTHNHPDGTSALYKLLIDAQDLSLSTWCPMVDTADLGGVTEETGFGVTATWMGDGSLGLFWGTGSRFEVPDSDAGAFFGFRDTNPLGCATPVPLCGDDGVFDLDPEEGLTDRPRVYAGVVLFPTWTPAEDDGGCGQGEGRLYGLDFSTCQGVLPPDDLNASPRTFLTVDGYPHKMEITTQGAVYVSTTGPTTVISDTLREVIAPGGEMRTKAMGYRMRD
ncbi:MAG: hypothetical protein H6739_35815 [Alphaproteobacteria bacterium]|nr:hypothetical protein [Alphaproteobacteria bacterium]